MFLKLLIIFLLKYDIITVENQKLISTSAK